MGNGYYQRSINYAKYFQVGIIILIASVIYLISFVNEFATSFEEINEYNKDICLSVTREIKNIKFNCWSNELANIVEMPCLKVQVHSREHKNITFFRNISEKLFARQYNV